MVMQEFLRLEPPFLSLSPAVLWKSPFPYYTYRIIFCLSWKATPRSFVVCSYFVVPSFQADLTGAARALKKGNKITRDCTKVMTRAATVKRRPVNRFVSFVSFVLPVSLSKIFVHYYRMFAK